MYVVFFFFKQKTAYDMRISDWSSDVCSSDLPGNGATLNPSSFRPSNLRQACSSFTIFATEPEWLPIAVSISAATARRRTIAKALAWGRGVSLKRLVPRAIVRNSGPLRRSEEHTSELQSLMRISYAVFCLKKKHTSETENRNSSKHSLTQCT